METVTRPRLALGLDFFDAATVFDDVHTRYAFDRKDPKTGEVRSRAIGHTNEGVLLVVAFAERTARMETNLFGLFRHEKRKGPKEKPMKKTPGPNVVDPDNPPLTGKQLEHVRKGIPNTRAIRHQLKMTQGEFARAFGFSLSSVRDWEQGRHAPDTNTVSYLRTIAFEPERVLQIRKDARLAPT